tara:strand:- start:4977 stop:5444 length:468 start_codon:yes stop_codon:yes gene_type:complete
MKTLLALVIIVCFTKCGGTKFVESPPFKITSATYNHWVGGVPGVSGTNVRISYTADSNVVFDSIYFLKRSSKLELKKINGTKLLMGYFKNESSNQKADYILHVAVEKEMGNKPPPINNFLFDLKENEAVISYKKGTKIKYFKIKSLKSVQPEFFY